MLLHPNGTEEILVQGGKAMADFVIADDLIVQGSACVGLERRLSAR